MVDELDAHWLLGALNALLIRNLDLRVVESRVPLHDSDPRGGVRAEVQVAECRDLIAWPGVDLDGRTVLVPNICSYSFHLCLRHLALTALQTKVASQVFRPARGVPSMPLRVVALGGLEGEAHARSMGRCSVRFRAVRANG